MGIFNNKGKENLDYSKIFRFARICEGLIYSIVVALVTFLIWWL